MNTNQPIWKLLANLGDISPLDYGGYFVFKDESAIYCPEAELLEVNDADEENMLWRIFRFSIPRCTFVNGCLSDNKFHPNYPVWFAKSLHELSEFSGWLEGDLIEQFTSPDPLDRAQAWKLVGDYHGFLNLDQYPAEYTDRAKVVARYGGQYK